VAEPVTASVSCPTISAQAEALCAQEPIHCPDAIQPHGALLAARADDGRITHASANLAAFIGRPAPEVLGRPLAELIGAAAWQASAALGRGGAASQHVLKGPQDRTLSLRLHRTGPFICVDLEFLHPGVDVASQAVLIQPVLERFKTATTRRELCELAVQGLRSMTGYDRVIAYRFAEDGHGEVVSEARQESLEPYLGLCFPASDIPAQARRKYMNYRIGMVADAAYEPVALLVDHDLAGGHSLDLTCSILRSVSPMHRAYMRHMGTAASLTVGLLPGQNLWGLLVCHHMAPVVAGIEQRAAAALVGYVVSILLDRLQAAESEAARDVRLPLLSRIAVGLSVAKPMEEALADIAAPLLEVVGATGAVTRLAGRMSYFGRVPRPAAAERLLNLMYAAADGNVLAADDAGPRFAAGEADGEAACGAMLAKLGHGSGDAVMWLRPEQSRVVSWGGNPSLHMATDPATGLLLPRQSFETWQEELRGRSARWGDADRALALEVGQVLAAELAQRTRMELQLERAQGASRAKSRFLAGMSHELRTPLNGLLGYAQLLRMEGGLSPQQMRRVDSMLSAGTHLLQVISRVLEFSEIEADRTVLNPAPFDPRRLVSECLDVVRPMAEGKQLRLRAEVSAEVLPEVTTDPTRFRQILLNLLGNAVKFTPRGEVLVRLLVARDGLSLRIEVADTGPGIPPEKRHRLFGEYQQLGSTMEAANEVAGGSTGLGLSITARLASLLGGHVGHMDNPAGGSIFWVELPPFLGAAQPPAPPPAAPPPPPAPAPVARSSRLRVLVADDSSINRDVASAFLRAAGHDVLFAEDGLEAVAAVMAEDFDVVLMDIRMPRMGGLEAARRIRGIPGARGRVPIVALTAQAFAEQVDECRKASMDGHLSKPFTQAALLAALAEGIAANACSRLAGDDRAPGLKADAAAFAVHLLRVS
jgi:light-regulated signal transduction histidine kinase (bacteriophytochrome)/CheY-like chemotaxis protein